MRRMRWGCQAGFWLLAACLSSAGASEKVSFSRDLAPVLRNNCATCHLTGQEPGGMKLYPSAAYASLVNVASTESALARVKPGQPEQSYLMHKLDGTHLDVGGAGERMPFSAPQLDEGIRNQIRAWIKSGAKNN